MFTNSLIFFPKISPIFFPRNSLENSSPNYSDFSRNFFNIFPRNPLENSSLKNSNFSKTISNNFPVNSLQNSFQKNSKIFSKKFPWNLVYIFLRIFLKTRFFPIKFSLSSSRSFPENSFTNNSDFSRNLYNISPQKSLENSSTCNSIFFPKLYPIFLQGISMKTRLQIIPIFFKNFFNISPTNFFEVSSRN